MSERRELPDDPALGELRSQFLNAVAKFRPVLHRFCTRMCGSVLDGEDLVQEILAAASYKVTPANPGFLEPSLLKMAHQACEYFIRLDRGHRESRMMYGDGVSRPSAPRHVPHQAPIEESLAARAHVLQPLERTAVVAKDVLGYSLVATTELIGTTYPHVKLALYRGRAILRELPPLTPSPPIDPERLAMFRTLAECFNRLDAAVFRRLVRADARVEILGAFSGRMSDMDSLYAGTYAAIPWEWTQSVALVDGDPVLVTSRRDGDGWQPYSAVRLWWERGQVVRIRDYMHIRHILRDARIEPVSEPPDSGRVLAH
jgi:RNA polymerase sigma-70 factor, ECF subfamily